MILPTISSDCTPPPVKRPANSEPVRLPHEPHRGAAFVPFEAVKVQQAIQVVTLVLERLRHETFARKLHHLTGKIEAAHSRVGMPRRRMPQPGHGETSLTDQFSLSAQLHNFRVEHIANVAVNVVAERSHTNANLRGSHPRATRNPHAIEQIGYKRTDAAVNCTDVRAGAFQHRVTKHTNSTLSHSHSPPTTACSGSCTSVFSDHAAPPHNPRQFEPRPGGHPLQPAGFEEWQSAPQPPKSAR